MTITTSNNFGTAKWIVAAKAGLVTHTTIATALTAASSGDTIFIRPGTYTENLTLKAGVNLVAYVADGLTPNVTIVGKCTFTTAGSVSCSGIRFQTNSDFAIAVTGSAASVLNISNCYLACSNNTGISFTSSSASSQIHILWCKGDITTTGISLFSMSAAGLLEIKWTEIRNTGAATTASTSSAGTVNLFYCYFQFPMSMSSTNTYSSANGLYDCGALNTSALTCGASNGAGSTNDLYIGGTASCVTVTTQLQATMITADSSNTNPITGAGTFSYATIDFPNSGKAINVTTQNNDNSSSFTPVLKFGGGTTGITYSSQEGVWTRYGNVLFINIYMVLTSKGSSTGTATITGLPFASSSVATLYELSTQLTNITVAGATGYKAALGAAATTLTPVSEIAATGVTAVLADTTFANNTSLRIQGFYYI